MPERHAVTVATVTNTPDIYGDSTPSQSTQAVSGLLFAPEGLVENDGTDAARVVGDATLYGVMPKMDSAATVTHTSDCCDGADFAFGAWLVVGGSKGWGAGKKATAIQRTAAQ